MTRAKLVCCLRRCGITGSASPVDGLAQAARPEQPNTAQAQAKDKEVNSTVNSMILKSLPNI